VTAGAGSAPSDFSANHRAPILVADGRGHQVINEASDAPVRAPLFAGGVVEAAA
jgi:flagellar assembly factor FliW